MSIDNQIDVLKELINKVSFLERELERIKAYDTPGAQFPVKYLRTGIGSASWNGGARSTTAKTVIDLSATFVGVPAGIEAVYIAMIFRDSGSAAFDALLELGPQSSGVNIQFDCAGQVNDSWERLAVWIPCDQNGDIYYNINASGVNTMDVYLFVWGWQYKTR